MSESIRSAVEMREHRRLRRGAAAALALALVSGLAISQEAEDERDLVRLRGGKELRCRVHARYDPEHVVIRRGNQLEELPRKEVDLIVSTVREQLARFLSERKEGLSVDEEWGLVERAQALGLPEMARLQAWHVLSLDPGDGRAHEFLGHSLKNGEWRWVLDGRDHLQAEFDQRIAQWKTRLVLRSENYELQTDAGLRRAVDTLFDLEGLYVRWLDSFGETLRATEGVIYPHERMTFLVYRDKQDEGFKDYLTQEREPFYDASFQTTTKEGNFNVAFTYYSDRGYRPERLFDLAVQQLMYSTLYLGHRRGAVPETVEEHLSHWVELGMGYWLGSQFAGSPGYPRMTAFVLDPKEARLTLVRPGRGPLSRYQEEVTNLVSMEFRAFYGTGEQVPMHRAKARTLVAFMMEANVPLEARNQVVGYSRDGLLHYLREVYGTPTAGSSSALDDGLGAKVEHLEGVWKEWVGAQL